MGSVKNNGKNSSTGRRHSSATTKETRQSARPGTGGRTSVPPVPGRRSTGTPTSPPRDHVAEVVEVVRRLRAPGGCPWDREQTHDSLKRFLVEETGEFLEAVEEGDDAAMVDELGDILLQILLHAEIAREGGRFDFQTVARRCAEKMVHRHPHVFGGVRLTDAAAVLDQWDEIKKREVAHKAPPSALGKVARHLPALERAHKLQRRAAKVGFDWPSVDGVLGKVQEEIAEVRTALARRRRRDGELEEELGDLLFAVVNLCRFRDLHAEELLHRANRKFERRFARMEAMLAAAGRHLTECPLGEMDEAWNRAKAEEKRRAGKRQSGSGRRGA